MAADSRWPVDSVVLAAQQGDPDALVALVEGSWPGVRRFAFTLCATPQDAEDAAQEALLILYRKVGTLRATAALTSWMFKVVRNECVRRWARTPPPVVRDPVSSPEDDVLARLELERIIAAIAALPADQRKVLVLRDVQHYSGREVAEALGLSTAAMKSRLHRARQALREALEA